MSKFEFTSFSGHRDVIVPESELDRIAEMYRHTTWVHGDARDGFDAQVRAYAIRRGIRHLPIPPEYQFPSDKVAPLIRNCAIVNISPRLVVAYDGRYKGGTAQAFRYAESLKREIIRLKFTKGAA